LAGVLIRLKLATLRHSWRGGAASMLWWAATAGLAIAAWTWYQAASEENTARALEALAVSFAVWALIWLALPLVGGSGGDPLRPESFRLLPIRPRRLAMGLLAASAVGVLPLVTFLSFAGLLIVAAGLGPAAVLVAVVAILLSLTFVIVLSRVVVGAMGAAMESRLGLELAAIQYAVLVALSFVWLPIGIVAADGDADLDALAFLPSPEEIAQALPTGWGAVAVDFVSSGDWPLAVAALVGLLGLSALLVLAWAELLSRRLRGVGGGSGRTFRPAAAWDRLGRAVAPGTPLGGVVGKELRVWARHPRRTLELRVALWSALFLTVVPGVFGARDVLWPWTGAVVVVVAAVGYANVYGMDGTSLWLTLLAPGSAGHDVRGRQLAWLLAVGPLALVVSLILTAAAGEAAALPSVLAVLPALLGAAAGLATVLALRSPAPLPERRGSDPLDLGDDPTTGSALMLQGLIVVVAVPLMAAPGAAAVWLLPSPAHWLGVSVGVATGVLYAWALGRAGAGYLARNGPELLDRLRARPAPVVRASTVAPSADKERFSASAATTLLATAGIILLVPQGVVALVFALVGADVRSWFLALYLPQDLQVPTSVLSAMLGALALGAAWRPYRRDRRDEFPIAPLSIEEGAET
jgi:ABC-2 type transport system permease protein